MKLITKRIMLRTKKVLNQVVIYIFGVVLGFGIYEAGCWGVKKYNELQTKKAGESLTLTLYARPSKNGKIEVYNKELKKVVGYYDQVFDQDYGATLNENVIYNNKGSVMVYDNGLYGYLNPTTGEVLVEPRYILAWESDPESGLAACVNNELKLGFVNVKTGQIAIPFKFEIDSAYLRRDRVDHGYFEYVFRDGFSLVPGANGKIGVINKAGEIILPIEYDDMEVKDYGCLSRSWYDIWCASVSPGILHRDFYNNYSFNQPVILKKLDSIGMPHYGLFDTNWNKFVSAIYDKMTFVDINVDVLALCQKNGVLRGIDRNGSLKDYFCLYDDCTNVDCASVLREPEGSLSPFIRYMTLNGYAIMDVDYRVVIEPDNYVRIEYLGDGLFSCYYEGGCSVIKKV